MKALSYWRSLIIIFGLCGTLSSAAQTANPQEVLAAVVGVHAQVPRTARTADTLGTERRGSGVVIDDKGLILTVGYLILEALQVEVTPVNGERIPTRIVAYDHASGLGLLRATRPLNSKPIQLGETKALQAGSPVLIISRKDKESITPVQIMARKTFAGTWEYLLDDAIFTSPPHRDFNGAALIGNRGELLGIGSLIMTDVLEDQPTAQVTPGNMFIPIDLLPPILPDLLASGHSRPVRPWLGLYAGEYRGYLLIDRLAEGGPAAQAGLTTNDLIVAVAQQPVNTLSELFRQVWALGDAGVTVPITVLREGKLVEIQINSGDRYSWLRLNPSL